MAGAQDTVLLMKIEEIIPKADRSDHHIWGLDVNFSCRTVWSSFYFVIAVLLIPVCDHLVYERCKIQLCWFGNFFFDKGFF
jgi:hypothetical protein